MLEVRDEDFHGFCCGEFGELAAELGYALVFVGVEKQFIAAGSGFNDLDRRKNAHLGNGSIEVELHVSSAFELLENEVVHAAVGLDERSTKNGETATLFGIAGGTEEFSRLGEGFGIDASTHCAAFSRLEIIVGPGHAGDRIEKDNHVAAEFHEALSTVGNRLADLNVAGDGFVKSGCVYFAIQGPSHISDFFWSFVHEEDDEGGIGMIFADACGGFHSEEGIPSMNKISSAMSPCSRPWGGRTLQVSMTPGCSEYFRMS